MPLPEVEKISALITALKLYSDSRVESNRKQLPSYVFDPPRLASWDALDWYELVHDWELIDFLVSGTPKADRLLRSLQSCLQWFEHAEIDEVLESLRIIN